MTMETAQKVQRFLVDELQLPVAEITPDHPLIANQLLDSLGILQVVSFLESEFGISVEDDELVVDNFGSISSMVRLVDSKLAKAAAN
jgi:acyl carrier protein